MPAVHGGLSEEELEAFEQYLIEGGPYENQSEAVKFCVRYTLSKKYGLDL